MNISHWFKTQVIPLRNLFTPTLVATICNHETKQKGTIVVAGKTSILTIPVDDEGHTPYCLDCIGKMSVRCVVCGGTIYVGDGIVLYPVHLFKKLPTHAVRYRHDKEYVIGCRHPKCVDIEGMPVPAPIFSAELSPYTPIPLNDYRLRLSCQQLSKARQ